jgi:hypothetical protein
MKAAARLNAPLALAPEACECVRDIPSVGMLSPSP